MNTVSSNPNLHSDLRTNLFDLLTPGKFAFPGRLAIETADVQIQNELSNALENPLDYPALRESVFAGDKVAIALANGLPCPTTILSGLLNNLQEAGIQSTDVTVVVGPKVAIELGLSADEIQTASNAVSNDAPEPSMISVAGLPISVLVHTSSLQTSVSYLAANETGDPIYLNRYLVDADVVIPVSSPTGNSQDSADSLYPEFSIDKTRVRFAEGDLNELEKEAEIQLANDTLGSFYLIQVIVGPGGGIEKILSGARAIVQAEARKLTDLVWSYQGPTNCEVVVATIESTNGKPSWDDFVQAVIAASHISTATSPIIVWSDLETRPSKQIRQSLQAQFETETETEKKLPLALKELTYILQSHPIYLLSRLSRNDVESLGLGYLDSAAQINRIAENKNGGVVLRDAHRYRFHSETVATSKAKPVAKPAGKRSARKSNKSS